MPASATLQKSYDWYSTRLRVAWLDECNRLWPRRVTGDGAAVVSLTTHSTRIAKVHTAIQSIAAGRVRPQRLILWLGESEAQNALPITLQRLQRQGLEVRYCKDMGPHTKYFPYACEFGDDALPLVTADDDCIYARDWLQGLLAAYHGQPGLIHGYWARRIALADGQILPYRDWGRALPRPSALHMALGVSGVVYPPAFVRALRDAGDAFVHTCPKADDVWLHVVALRQGFQVQQILPEHNHPPTIPFTQDIALFHSNLLPDGNDAQIRKTYSAADLAALQQCAG